MNPFAYQTSILLLNKERERAKIQKYAEAYKEKLNIHFIPVVFESGGAFGKKAQDVFRKICNLITQTSGQSGSAIAYFYLEI